MFKEIEQRTETLYPSEPIEKIDLEQKLEKNQLMLTVLKAISATLKKRLHTSRIKIMNQKVKNENYKTLNTMLESVDTIVLIGSTTSVKLSGTGICLITLPTSAGIACTLSLGNKVLYKIIIKKCKKYKKNKMKKINKQLNLLIN